MTEVDLTKYEIKAEQRDVSELDEIRRTLADVYAFVRSNEYHKSVISYTLDHYLIEAKKKIDRSQTGERPSQLMVLEKLEQDFGRLYEKARALAEKADDSEA